MTAEKELRERVTQLRKDARYFDGGKGISQEQLDNLEAIRELLGLTRKEFCSSISLPVGSYEKWLADPSKFSKLHFRWFYFKVYKRKPATQKAE